MLIKRYTATQSVYQITDKTSGLFYYFCFLSRHTRAYCSFVLNGAVAAPQSTNNPATYIIFATFDSCVWSLRRIAQISHRKNLSDTGCTVHLRSICIDRMIAGQFSCASALQLAVLILMNLGDTRTDTLYKRKPIALVNPHGRSYLRHLTRTNKRYQPKTGDQLYSVFLNFEERLRLRHL